MAQSIKVVWTNDAKEELRDMYSNLLDEAPRFADELINEIEKTVANLSQFPEMGRVLPEKNLSFLREISIRKYRIIYVYVDLQIFVVAIRHQNRRLDKL